MFSKNNIETIKQQIAFKKILFEQSEKKLEHIQMKHDPETSDFEIRIIEGELSYLKQKEEKIRFDDKQVIDELFKKKLY